MVRLPCAFTRNTPPTGGVTLELELLGTTELDVRELELLLITTLELLLTTLELLLMTRELLLLETRELLDELEGGNEEELTTLEELPQLLRPNGAGWLVQVAREIQLLLFS